jgi:cAMP phosphodiesterase
MEKLLKVLGASGSKTKTTGTISFQIGDNILIDAGNIFQKFEKDTNEIEHVFISHSHFDHIQDLPFLIENSFTTRKKQLHIYGLKDTIMHIKQFMFNDYIWPDFSLIPLLTTGEKSIVFNEVQFGQVKKIGDVSIRMFPANHIVPTTGFIVEKNGRAFALSSDTYKNRDFWEIINYDRKIKYVLIEVSFESALDKLAEISKHLTPKLLDEELNYLKRDDVKIYIYHIKESSISKIKEELKLYPNLVKFGVELLPDELN